ncbi:27786_t:CDS:2 [Dentiscutata erythropus]|uniref:27786_t:CDS:1 n=1 Tax=Dentiscutata erythropus TaxID=1348616 RepID=A0A9N9GYK1_9GLOM|nr:27786_t:CDS:2 [Dentiscutata erythropus]
MRANYGESPSSSGRRISLICAKEATVVGFNRSEASYGEPPSSVADASELSWA